MIYKIISINEDIVTMNFYIFRKYVKLKKYLQNIIVTFIYTEMDERPNYGKQIFFPQSIQIHAAILQEWSSNI